MIVFSMLPFISMLTGILVVLFIRIPIFAVALIIFVITYTAISYFAYRKISDLTKQEAAANNRQTGQPWYLYRQHELYELNHEARCCF